MSPDEALQNLITGNERFCEGRSKGVAPDFAAMAEGQQPFAAILGCSDSRVPVEVVFDQNFGDLFVARIAGNVAAPTQIGSLEFAVGQLGCALIVVLGHSGCGAVNACMHKADALAPSAENHIDYVLQYIQPALTAASGQNLEAAVSANVRHQRQRLFESSSQLKNAVEAGTLAIVGAEFNLSDGRVTFHDDA